MTAVQNHVLLSCGLKPDSSAKGESHTFTLDPHLFNRSLQEPRNYTDEVNSCSIFNRRGEGGVRTTAFQICSTSVVLKMTHVNIPISATGFVCFFLYVYLILY